MNVLISLIIKYFFDFHYINKNSCIVFINDIKLMSIYITLTNYRKLDIEMEHSKSDVSIINLIHFLIKIFLIIKS